MGEASEWRCRVLLLVGPREVVPAREELPSARTTDGTDAASPQRQRRRDVLRELLVLVVGHRGRRRAAPGREGSRLFAAEGRYQSCFGCRPAVYCSQFIYEHEWGCPCARTQRFLQKCDGTGRSKPRTVLWVSSAPGEVMGQRSQDASARAGRLPHRPRWGVPKIVLFLVVREAEPS
jgi:hypothetical protein